MKNIEVYKQNILSYENKNNSYVLNEKCVEYISTYKGCKFKLSININTHRIDSVFVSVEANSEYIQNVMNAFINIIKGIPILEAHDHGVLRLENLLRNETISHSVQGVIMPANSCELFQIPQYLIRDIFRQYCKNENYEPLANTYTSLEVLNWKKLSVEEREVIIKEKVSSFCKVNNIKDYDFIVLDDMRIHFIVEKNEYKSLGKLLFDMERSIGKELGFSLEIMFSEKKDANRKRKTKDS